MSENSNISHSVIKYRICSRWIGLGRQFTIHIRTRTPDGRDFSRPEPGGHALPNEYIGREEKNKSWRNQCTPPHRNLYPFPRYDHSPVIPRRPMYSPSRSFATLYRALVKIHKYNGYKLSIRSPRGLWLAGDAELERAGPRKDLCTVTIICASVALDQKRSLFHVFFFFCVCGSLDIWFYGYAMSRKDY